MRVSAFVAVSCLLLFMACGDDTSPSNNNSADPECGNGVTEGNEECDAGEFNSDVAPDGCRLDCRRAYCGDGVLDSDEACDDGGTDSDDGCAADCTDEPGWDCTGSPCEPVCGDSLVVGDEACDGTDLQGQDCTMFGHAAGVLLCAGDCTLDFADCGVGAECGNSLIETGEVCDGSDLGGQGCTDFGHTGGVLACDSNCTWDFSGCSSVIDCGNGIVETGEDCDGADFAGATCANLGFVGGGIISCVTCQIDTGTCCQDQDGDGYGTNCLLGTDCNDASSLVNPGAQEVCDDGVDNNCDGNIDAAEPDYDGDGFGSCHPLTPDCDDTDPLVGPLSLEIPGDGLDNDCNGVIDDAVPTDCDCQAPNPGETASETMAKSIGMCNPILINNVSTSGNPIAYGAFTDWGAVVPRTSSVPGDGLPANNCRFMILSTGRARVADPQGSLESDLGISGAVDPAPASLQDGAEIHDLTQFHMTLVIPSNVFGFSFDYIFLTSEYPEWICSEFNDTFYGLATGDPAINGGQLTNLTFDVPGGQINTNNQWIEQAPNWSLSIAGTGYEDAEPFPMCGLGSGIPGCTPPNPCPAFIGSTTGWLRTTSPATPGATVTITFSIHDEGDGVLDSAVAIDNFQWHTAPVTGPVTVK